VSECVSEQRYYSRGRECEEGLVGLSGLWEQFLKKYANIRRKVR
jgi:hypothetical protein